MKRYATLIGCGKYKNSADFVPLKCAIEDVKSLSAVLSDPKVGNFDSVKTFTKGESHTTVLKHLENLLNHEVRSDDTVLIYFSGHAAVDRLNQLHLALRATEKATISATSLPIAQLIGLMSSSRCRDAVLILDCCYSGAARNAFKLPPNWTGQGFSIITSSTDNQKSKAKEGELTSIFTKFLLEGLTSGDADLNNDGVISADEAYQYAFNCVKGSGLQTPMEFSIRQGTISLAKNRNHRSLPDSSEVPPDQLPKFLAIQNLIKLVGENPESRFMIVLLPHYYIEGERYRASGLTVSQDHTPNMRQTADAFKCDTFFPPHLLTPHAKKGKEVVNGVIKVRMEVKNENIFIVSGMVGGQQVDLLK